MNHRGITTAHYCHNIYKQLSVVLIVSLCMALSTPVYAVGGHTSSCTDTSSATASHSYLAYDSAGNYVDSDYCSAAGPPPDPDVYEPLFENENVVKVVENYTFYCDNCGGNVGSGSFLIGRYKYSVASEDLGTLSCLNRPSNTIPYYGEGILTSAPSSDPQRIYFTAAQDVKITRIAYGTSNITEEYVVATGKKISLCILCEEVLITSLKKNQTITCQDITTTYNSAKLTINASVSE